MAKKSAKTEVVAGIRWSKPGAARLRELAKSCGLTEVDYLRSLIDSEHPRLRPIVPAVNRVAWAQMSTTTANLNQIAHTLNLGRIPRAEDLQADFIRAYDEFHALRGSLLEPADSHAERPLLRSDLEERLVALEDLHRRIGEELLNLRREVCG